MPERLQKLMARAGRGSRRHNETLIRAGRVRVNGRVAQLGDSADVEHDTIEVDGQRLTLQPLIYIVLHKPRGVLSSTEDELQQGRPGLRSLVPLPGHFYPVGRLDKESEGLILLTNDGEMAHRLTHPRYEHEKTYLVWVEGQPTPDTLARWRAGVTLDGTRTAPARVEVLGQAEGQTRLRVILREGRKRQIRRVAAQLGHPVQRLVRIAIGPLQLTDLKPGAWRRVTAVELRQLQQAVAGQARKGHEI